MRKSTLVLTALLAACFMVTTAEAAKKKMATSKVAVDPVYEWNLKNIPPMPQPGAAAAAPGAPAKKGKKAKKG
jgi:hypothetical protein